MTIPGWGKLTPVQAAMVNLAGHAFDETADSQEGKRRAIAYGRWELREITGEDFGFDIGKWHEYLMQAVRTGYSHSYGWNQIFPAIQRAINDSIRQQLVEQLEGPQEQLTSEGLAITIAEALIHEGLLDQGLQTVVPVIQHEIHMRKILGEA